MQRLTVIALALEQRRLGWIIHRLVRINVRGGKRVSGGLRPGLRRRERTPRQIFASPSRTNGQNDNADNDQNNARRNEADSRLLALVDPPPDCASQRNKENSEQQDREACIRCRVVDPHTGGVKCERTM